MGRWRMHMVTTAKLEVDHVQGVLILHASQVCEN